MSRRLLVIGVGFLGKEIVQQAESRGDRVYGASRNGDVYADLSELDSLRTLQDELRPDAVIHCAASGKPGKPGRSGRSADRVASYRAVYLKGCENLVAAFPSAKKLFTSSTSVYGQIDGSTVSEDSETVSSSETANVLLEAEEVVLNAGGRVARLSGIYGNGRSYMLRRLFSGEAVIGGDGARLLNHIHHVDAASACLFLLDQEAGIYNVSDSECLSERETYQRLCETFGLPFPKQVSGKDVIASKRGYSDKCVSSRKLMDLGWRPRYGCFADAAEEVAVSLGLKF